MAYAALNNFGQALQLHQANRRLQISQPVIPRRFDVLFTRRLAVTLIRTQSHAVLAQMPHSSCVIGTIRGDCAALAHGQNFARMKRKDRKFCVMRNRLAAVGRANRARCVFNERDIFVSAPFYDGCAVKRDPQLMHRDERANVFCPSALQGLDCNNRQLGVDVGENRLRTRHPNGIGRGDKRQRWNQNGIAAADARRDQGKVQACGGRGDGDHLFRADSCRQLLFKFSNLWPLGDPTGAQNCGYGLLLLWAKNGFDNRQHSLSRAHRTQLYHRGS